MKYMLLIYDDQDVLAEKPREEVERGMAAWWEFDAAVKKGGVYVSGEALKPADTAVTVRGGGERKVLRSFGATKEQLGGYYVLDVADVGAAARWAERMPRGTIEIRPVEVFDQK